MREINLDKSRCIGGIVLFGGFSLFWVFGLIKIGIYDKDESFDKNLLFIVPAIGFSLWLIKSFFEYLIPFLRFYNLRIEMLRDKLILRTDTKECEIPMTEDTTVVCCMDGWLIVWPSKKGNGIILLPRGLLGDNFLELCFYFQENASYIPSQDIIPNTKGNPLRSQDLDYYQPNVDYEAAEKEKKKLLKSLKIKDWILLTWNPLKYAKWPA
ncbi:MAG: hypothetical protein ABSF37_03895 [Sedimentisphaerales bacterium]|jgi:hypothetical protein